MPLSGFRRANKEIVCSPLFTPSPVHFFLMKVSFIAPLLFAIALVNGCTDRADADLAPADALFERLTPAATGIDFTNEVSSTAELNIFNYRNFYNGGGVGLADVNNDGWTDVFLTSNLGANKLYLNRGDWQFEDVSVGAGIELADKWSTGVVMVDVNADGWLDIYVCNAGFRIGSDQHNSLFLNNQDGTFREAAAEFGLDDAGYTTHAAFFDYDGDGDLDAYLLNNSFIPVNTLNESGNRELYAEDWRVKDFLKGGGDKLLRNDDGKFVDVSEEAGIYGSLIGFGLGVTVGDVNGDMLPDIYVSNDFFERDYLYINRGDGTFAEEIQSYLPHLSLASMGTDMADINNDGYPEIFATEMLPESDYRRKTTVQFERPNLQEIKRMRGFYNQFMHNTLQLNNGDGTFSEIAHYAGVEASDWSWGALLFDADLDGWRDILVCNGIYHSLTDQDFIDFFADEVVTEMARTGKREDMQTIIDRMPSEPLANKLYRNRGDLRFTDMAEEWGLGDPSFSNGAAYGDLDNDGDQDLVINNVNQPAFIYRNRAVERGANPLTVRLRGPAQNPFAIGANVSLYAGREVQTGYVMPTRGFQSSVPYSLTFGLDSNLHTLDSLVVAWPDGSSTSVDGPTLTGSIFDLDYADPARTMRKSLSPPKTGLLQEMQLGLAKHEEDPYLDLLNEGLVIRSLAREGPRAAVGDLNGDGLEDLIVGGAFRQATQYYLQRNGELVVKEDTSFRSTTNYEDTALTLFDADGDGDLDLYAGSGGNFANPDAPALLDRLYRNDGNGNFTLSENSLPAVGVNTAVAVALDYDADGDEDLFVGTRSLPRNYGARAASILLENDGTGKFRDVTDKVATSFEALGMVTDAVWTQLHTGREPQLVVTNEWGGVNTFEVRNGKFEEIPTELTDLNGWWYTVHAVDVDGDGDKDLVLGNRGENFYFSAGEDRPVKLWVADFDDNGSDEKILTTVVNGKDMPVTMRRELTDQLPSLKKRALAHAEYAKQDIRQLIGQDRLDRALQYSATYFRSAVALNQGQGQFTLKPLPASVQFSSVAAVADADLNGDGLADLLLGGNFSAFLPQFSRLDGSYGHVLLSQGRGEFAVLPNSESGMLLRGDVKQLLFINLGGVPHLLAIINDAAPVVYRLPAVTAQ